MFVAGIDIGSLTAKAVILDDEARVVGQALTLPAPSAKKRVRLLSRWPSYSRY